MKNFYFILAVSAAFTLDSHAEVKVDEQHAGVTQDLPFQFTDETGQLASLNDFFTPKVHLVQFVYFNCGSICSPFLNETLHSLRVLHSEFKLGRDFDLWTFSVNPRETSSLAKEKKKNYLAELSQVINVESPQSWHFMTGVQSSIDSLTQKVGFHFEAIDSLDYNHKAVILVLDKDQNLVSYVHGPMLYPYEIKAAILKAQGGVFNWGHKFYLDYVYRLAEGDSHYKVSLARQMLFFFLIGLLVLIPLGTLYIIHHRLKSQKDT